MRGYRLVMLPPQDEATRSWATRLVAQVPGLEVVVAETEAVATEAMATAQAAYGTPTPAMLAVARGLRWLQAPAAAPPAGYFSDELVAHPVVVTNLRGIYNDHVATHAVALTLALARGLQHYLPGQREGRWEPRVDESSVVHLPDATVLVVGLGGIGGEIARMVKAFGCRVTATDARVADPGPWVDEFGGPGDLDRLLPEADFVILTVPHTPQTEGLIDLRRLKLMKPSAHFVNVGRGMTVRLDDLVVALRTGEIAGAALDVFEQEPLPPNHPLWRLPNVLLTPHVAVAGPHVEERRFGVLLDNARRFGQDEELINVVDKAAWF